MKKHLLDYINQAKSGSVRGLRILVEYFYALEMFEPIIKSNIHIVSVFGSARLKPQTKEYKTAKKLGALLYKNGFAVLTGASMGIMGAANEGAADGIIEGLKKQKKFSKMSREEILKTSEYKREIKKYSTGLKISLPFEPYHNPHLGVVATFHYFMVRKFFFGTLSSAFIACEGGWGTRDELFEILTLVQTGKAPLMPIIYVTDEPKHLVDDLKFTIKKGLVSKEDKHLIQFVSDYRKAVDIIKKFYSVVKKISYDKRSVIEVYLTKPLTAKQQKKAQHFVDKKHAGVFKSVSFSKTKMELFGYNYKSYGFLRLLINELAA